MKQQGDVRKASSDNPSFEHMNAMEVGTASIDINDDDELFSGMNDKDFGSKGITDADFQFLHDNDRPMK